MTKTQKISRQVRVRKQIRGTDIRPRLSVFRSNKSTYAQVIDDKNKITIVAASEKELAKPEKSKKTDKANELGKLIAKKAIAKD